MYKCSICADLFTQMRLADESRSESREIADCYLFLNVTLPLAAKDKAVTFFFFGWMLENISQRCDLTDSFMDLDGFLAKFASAIESSDPDAVGDALSKAKALLRVRFGESDFKEILAIIAVWLARALEIHKKPDLALLTLLEASDTVGAVEFPVSYSMARLIGSMDEGLSLNLVSPYWRRWGGNWKSSVDAGTTRLGMFVILAHCINEIPAVYFMADHDATLLQNDEAADAVRLAKENGLINAKGRLANLLLHVETDVRNLRVYSDVCRKNRLMAFLSSKYSKAISLAEVVLRTITCSRELEILKCISDGNDFLRLVRAHPLAAQFSQDVRDAHSSVRGY